MSESKHKVLTVYGTRPERIKLTPVIGALKALDIDVDVYSTVQSPDLLADPPEEGAKPGINWTNLTTGIAGVLTGLRLYLQGDKKRPDALLVQGDTATAFAGALAGFLEGVPVGHVEAGLRTYSDEPYPEEGFRQSITSFARWHFAPDKLSADNVLAEMNGLADPAPGWVPWTSRGIYITGNPIIDTLPKRTFNVLATLHRRENWGERLQNAIEALHAFAREHENARVVLISHPNWTKALPEDFEQPIVDEAANFWVERPLSRAELLAEMENADVIVTDSGGLQEEAAHFGVPCIVYRTATERTALLRAGAVELADPNGQRSLQHALERCVNKRTAYGSGDAGTRIASILKEQLDDLKGIKRPLPKNRPSTFGVEYD